MRSSNSSAWMVSAPGPPTIVSRPAVPVDGVRALAAVDQVISVPAEHDVVSAPGVDYVVEVAARTVEVVGIVVAAVGNADHIVAFSADDNGQGIRAVDRAVDPHLDLNASSGPYAPTVVCEVVGTGGAGEPGFRLEGHHAGRRVRAEGSSVGLLGPFEVGLGVGGGHDVVVEDRDLDRFAERGRGLVILCAGCGRRVGNHRRQHAHGVGAAVLVDLRSPGSRICVGRCPRRLEVRREWST